MSQSEQFERLTHCLAGVFQNRDQALAEPAWFVHLKLWSYPTRLFQSDSVTFFIEQASAAFPQPPYRQRMLRIQRLDNELTAEYYALQDPQAWQGAAQEPERLNQLTANDLQPLTGSRLQIQCSPETEAMKFVARHYPGERCQFSVNGEVKWVQLGFDAIAPDASSSRPAAFWMYDKGIDPTTEKTTWGATNGPFKLLKVENLAPGL